VQAAISALHARAATHEATDWREILLLYRRLHELQPTPVVELNALVARSYAVSPESALAALAALEGRAASLRGYQPFHLVKADLLRRTGDSPGAADAYRRALELTTNEAEAGLLRRRLEGLGSG